MLRIKHILFPVDFSDRSDGAASFVAALAAKYGAQVTLLSAAHANYAGGLAGAPMIDPQSILDAVQEQLDRTYLAEFSGLNVRRVTVPGEPAREIIDFAAAHSVDLIMMTTHGHGPFRQLLLGSVAAKCCMTLTCRVDHSPFGRSTRIACTWPCAKSYARSILPGQH